MVLWIYGSMDVRKFKWKHNAAIYRSFGVEFIKICRYKTFWMRIFAPRAFLLFRCCSIHVKMCVLVRYSGRKLTLNVGLKTAMFSGIPMSAAPTSDTEKRTETGRI